MDPKKKKTRKSFKSFDPSKYINTKPMMNEAKKSSIVISFGRMNPPTAGHEKLVNKVISEAVSRKADAGIYLSHTQDKKKNPLSYDDKLNFAIKAFGKVMKKSNSRTIIEIAKELNAYYENIVLVVGSDRVQEFETLLKKYNGTQYNFSNIEVISAGERDPDADDISGMSASKLRSLAAEGNKKAFTIGLPKKLKSSSNEIYDAVRKGLGMNEDTLEEARAPLTVQQRRRRGMTMRRLKNRLAIARKRAERRLASKEKLQTRSKRKARNIIRQRLMKNKSYGEMSPAEKVALDKRLMRIPQAVIDRIAKRQLPAVRKAEVQRLRSVLNPSKNEQFEMFLEACERDTQPRKRYHMALEKNGAVKFDKRFRFFRKSLEENSENILEEIMNLQAVMEEFELNLLKETNITEGENVAKAALAIAREKIANKQKHARMLDSAKARDKSVKEELDSSKPSNREHGTNSLVRILKKDTPGEKVTNEDYYSADIDDSYAQFEKGAKVKFTHHSMDMIDDEEKTGIVVGSNTQHLRIRDSSGKLYLVRHSDAELLESTVSRGFEGKKIIVKDKLTRMIDGSMKKMAPGKSASSKHGD
jgi:nicotinic acid mononucleotide adenylyltransferase